MTRGAVWRSSPLFVGEANVPSSTPAFGKKMVAIAIKTALAAGAEPRESNTDPDVTDDDLLVMGDSIGFGVRIALQVFSEAGRGRLRNVLEQCCVSVSGVFASVGLGRRGLSFYGPVESSLLPTWISGRSSTPVCIDTWLAGSVLNDALVGVPIPGMFHRELTDHGMWIVFNGSHEDVQPEYLKALSDVIHPQLMIVGEPLRSVPAPIRGRVKKGPPVHAFKIRSTAEFGVLSLRTDTDDVGRLENLRNVVEGWSDEIFRYGPELFRTEPVFRGEVRWRYDTSRVGIHEIPADLDELLRRIHAVEGVTVTEASFKDND